MKIAIASEGASWDSRVDRQFGRAHFFVLVDSERNMFSVCGNSDGRHTPYTAGMQAAGSLISLRVEAVIVANIGPRAFATFQAARVPVYRSRRETVRQALQHFKRGELSILEEANACDGIHQHTPLARAGRRDHDHSRNAATDAN